MTNVRCGASTVRLLTIKCLLGPAHWSMMTLDIIGAARGRMDPSAVPEAEHNKFREEEIDSMTSYIRGQGRRFKHTAFT